MGCALFYSVWSSVKLVLKLGHVWFSEGLVFQHPIHSAKIPALVIIILQMLKSWVSVSGGL